MALIPSGILRILGARCWQWGQRTDVFLRSVPLPEAAAAPALEAGTTGVHGGATDSPCWSFSGSLALHGGPAPKQLLPCLTVFHSHPGSQMGQAAGIPLPSMAQCTRPGCVPPPLSRALPAQVRPRGRSPWIVVASVLLTLRFLLRQSRHSGVSSGVQSTYLGQPKQWMVNPHNSKAQVQGHGTCRRGPLGEPPGPPSCSSALPSSSWGRGF